MKYSEKIFEKNFHNKKSKQAYLDACIWLAKNIYGKVELVDYISTNIRKVKTKGNQLPTFKVEIYATIDIKETNENFCKKCKYLHTIFYSIDKPDCNKCNKKMFVDEVIKQIEGVKDFLLEVIEKSEWEGLEDE